MSSSTTSVVCTDLSFAWPDGTPVFTDFSLVVSAGRNALIGVNGSGKSTLMRLIAGALRPQRGSVTVHGQLGYVPQDVALDAHVSVADALGIADVRAALGAIENGGTSEENFARVGNDWDVDERARATLDLLGLTGVSLERQIGEMSGGESVLLYLAAQFLRHPDVALLDEPTNNLDLDARHRLYDVVRGWPGTMIIVTHDRQLLDMVGDLALVAGRVEVMVPARYLPQRLDVLDDSLTVAQNVGRFAPSAGHNMIRAQLARFLFCGRRADQVVSTLSGGERFRATLAALLLAEPAPQLLLLDEPTNNLDMASVRELAEALDSYQGALILASHDVPFLRELGISRWLLLDGRLTDIDPL